MTMTRPYPIVDQRALEPSPKRGRWGMGQRYRESDEIPAAQAHQVLVYRVNGDYILDRASRGRTHEDVLNATHVSVVDIRQDYPVLVQLDIPSAEASEFKVRVTFVCTVEDPVLIVRKGVYDAAEVLNGYLKSHHRFFELGLDYRMSQINEVRRDVRAQVTAYTTVRPPLITGMAVRMASVEVLTPEELADFEKTRRGQRFDHTIASERQGFDHELRYDGQRNEQRLEHDQLMYERNRQYEQQRHDHLIAAEGQRNDLYLEYEKREFERRELEKAMEMFGDDPLQALRHAFASGQLSSKELAGELQARKDRDAEAEEAERERQREDERRREALEREDTLRERAQAREDMLRRLDWQREDAVQKVTVEREDRQWEREDRRQEALWAHEERQGQIATERAKELQQALWAREDILRREGQTREDKERLLEANLEVLREFAKTGHLDLVNFDLDHLVAELTGKTRAAENSVDAALESEAPELTEGEQNTEAEVDVDVREEDGD